MPGHIEFLFDFGSPTTFLAHKRLAGVVARTGATANYVPVLLGGVFKATGNTSPAVVPAKGAYMNIDMARYAKVHGILLQQNPHFPINTIMLMRMATGLRGTPRYAPYVDTIFNAMWSLPRDMGDPAIVAEVLTAANFDAAETLALAGDEWVKSALKAETEKAVARGVFGAPTFFIGDEMFFGQDRLDWVEAAVSS
ncbi:2-hydroxychromene-2-carboxylate isomerase [Glacieibacterium sp.]|uniref:2-hydroxychromene-2-carboxylate isomerase n=1 Tax=Glacieibacterium sp. TaxID=2860237 RepID=UPI003AFFE4A9